MQIKPFCFLPVKFITDDGAVQTKTGVLHVSVTNEFCPCADRKRYGSAFRPDVAELDNEVMAGFPCSVCTVAVGGKWIQAKREVNRAFCPLGRYLGAVRRPTFLTRRFLNWA